MYCTVQHITLTTFTWYNTTTITYHRQVVSHIKFLPSLVPRPHPLRREKGPVNLAKSLGLCCGISTCQSDCSFSTVIRLANCKNATVPLLVIQI